MNLILTAVVLLFLFAFGLALLAADRVDNAERSAYIAFLEAENDRLKSIIDHWEDEW